MLDSTIVTVAGIFFCGLPRIGPVHILRKLVGPVRFGHVRFSKTLSLGPRLADIGAIGILSGPYCSGPLCHKPPFGPARSGPPGLKSCRFYKTNFDPGPDFGIKKTVCVVSKF